jgi:hypothetical protein
MEFVHTVSGVVELEGQNAVVGWMEMICMTSMHMIGSENFMVRRFGWGIFCALGTGECCLESVVWRVLSGEYCLESVVWSVICADTQAQRC